MTALPDRVLRLVGVDNHNTVIIDCTIIASAKDEWIKILRSQGFEVIHVVPFEASIPDPGYKYE